jgi:hypothetical protein
VFNLGGALMFAFPDSVGQIAGLPVLVPPIYQGLLVLFVVLFAGVYAWLASQPRIDRPMVVLGAVGKAAAFAVVLVYWLFDMAAGRAVLAFSGDLILAGIFAAWLVGREA